MLSSFRKRSEVLVRLNSIVLSNLETPPFNLNTDFGVFAFSWLMVKYVFSSLSRSVLNSKSPAMSLTGKGMSDVLISVFSMDSFSISLCLSSFLNKF